MKKWFLPLLLCLLLCAASAGAEVVFQDLPYPPPGDEETALPETDIVVSQPVSVGEDPWPRTIVITVGGDCTLGTTDSQRKRADGFDAVVREKGLAWPFSGLLDIFSQDDMTLVNFEGTLTESTDKVKDKLFNFKGPAEYAQILTLGSVEAVNLANNHYIDYGDEGKTDTQAALTAQGITYCAKGQTAVYTVRGIKIGLIGNTFSYKEGKCDISADVKALREEGCQIILASFHWGSEYEYEYTRDQRNIGRAAIKSGASAVIGHHPHVVQGIELYEDTYILYSLGNLVFGGNTNPDDRDAYVAQLTFTVPESGEVPPPTLKIIPVRLTSLASGTDYRPVVAVDSYERILKKILNYSTNMKGFINPQ